MLEVNSPENPEIPRKFIREFKKELKIGSGEEMSKPNMSDSALGSNLDSRKHNIEKCIEFFNDYENIEATGSFLHAVKVSTITNIPSVPAVTKPKKIWF